MLNKSLEEYKALYSKYVEATVALHNYHIVFVNTLGLDSATNVRKSIKALSEIEKELKHSVHKARNEQVEINKLTKKARREQKNRNTSGLDPYNRKKNVDVPK
jgi:uncharacterized protein YjaZ